MTAIASELSNLSLRTDSPHRAGDYKDIPFDAKTTQFEAVLDLVDKAGFIPEDLIESEVRWFYTTLGIDDIYFARESAEGIATNIHALYSAKVQAYARGVSTKPVLQYNRASVDHAVYFDSSTPGSEDYLFNHYEELIDDKYLDSSDGTNSYRLESYTAPLDLENMPSLRDALERNNVNVQNQSVRLYFVYKTSIEQAQPDVTDIEQIGDRTFLESATDNTKRLYSEVLQQVSLTTGPVIRHFVLPNTNEVRVIIGYKQKSTRRYNSALSVLADYYNLTTTRKYVEQFANGSTVISMYMTPSDTTKPMDLSIHQVIKEASLLYSIPHNIFYDKFVKGDMSLQESIYAHCGVIFVTHFLNRLGPEYNSLVAMLDPSKSIAHAELLNKLKNRLRSETFTQSYIQEMFASQSEIVRKLYRQFADAHYIKSPLEETLSYKRLSKITPIGDEKEFEHLLARECSQNEHQALVLRALHSFNQSILKTNFYVSSKVAISFRLNPSFLPVSEYPQTPYGMFFIVGSDFRGFHIRFRDIARGGIRIVRSRSEDAYQVNVRNLFDENYNLASTQQRKNKDIPEGGSKGVILLDHGLAQENPQASFEKYIDSLIDLLLDQKQSKKEKIVDLYGKPEILFLGPDEGTAGYVDWATLHAKKRCAPWWRSFLTGKSPELGGIPHDEYGMTSLSVRAYVEKIYQKLEITDAKITKFQTGGPDGDLGSNEILLANKMEHYVAIVDGSGVIVDPKGLDSAEVLRLAKTRKMIDNYDKSKLSDEGYVCLVDDVDLKIPSGEVITSGIAFRNNFHTNLKQTLGKVDLFVPCGGRPAAIDTNNVFSLIDENTGRSIIPYIVEGANLFITQPAKVILENAGAIVFKDASTNKGGVTSSSFEVLAALSFDDEGFKKNMCISSTGVKPALYQAYVSEVQKLIQRNANLEFESLWALRQSTGKALCDLSDTLSVAINQLADDLASSKELWEDDKPFRNSVLNDALPDLLLAEIGLDNILARVPEAYLRALFATHLASRFVYSRGIDVNPAKFLEYISATRKELQL
ncbi:hypothetical protein BABINDRAFT_163325 [Babjeviella inositovora NRRL Y-12698]|uniref:NAD-specific glutamate dehydrogenase n=1 Tax=Babjeviella inositovora NRRL Y-12698 TaxID=984486 RepID=A0A1E3QIR2_9ASCO|nr:uncharacterized protein BABINDRAFT_163325 [Babjeviella inositovora NRRL Y-12698]ODQ77596.1 hypothetical protein BABINDRAFT_163325 [Babjeviella inositovora NRRL Y-12698]